MPPRGVEIRGAPSLGASEAHVWQVDTDSLLPRAAEWAQLLSPDEWERAARLRRPLDRKRFAIRRGICRTLLARYAGTTPEALQFTYGQYGQPILASPGGLPPFRFSFSHAEGLSLLAVTRGVAIGVDVERVRVLHDMRTVARHLFSTRERQELGRVPEPRMPEAFFRCWTRKEAFVKATGAGLTFPLDSFDVSVTEPARLHEVRSTSYRAAEWSLHHLSLGDPYVGAVAMAHQGGNVVLREWEG